MEHIFQIQIHVKIVIKDVQVVEVHHQLNVFHVMKEFINQEQVVINVIQVVKLVQVQQEINV